MIYSSLHPKVQEKTEDFLNVPSIYAHGDLEDRLHFDLLSTDSISTYNLLFHYHWENNELDLPEKAQTEEGEILDVMIYAWHARNDRTLGLVVLNGDEESKTYAKEKQKEKPTYI